LPEPTNITDELWRAADDLLCQRLPAGHLPVRPLGMGVSGLDSTGLVQALHCDPHSIIYAQKMHRNHARNARNARNAQPR
jgi:hypothetical protein